MREEMHMHKNLRVIVVIGFGLYFSFQLCAAFMSWQHGRLAIYEIMLLNYFFAGSYHG